MLPWWEWRRVVDPATGVELIVPAHVDDGRAIARAARERAGEMRRLRFFVDHGHDYPLWESGTGAYTMEPADFGISASLGEQLWHWCDFWFRHSHYADGFDSPENERAWRAEGRELSYGVACEVYDTALVIPEYRGQMRPEM